MSGTKWGSYQDAAYGAIVLLGRWTAMRRRRNWMKSISSKAPRRIALDISSGIVVWNSISSSVVGSSVPRTDRSATKASATSL